MTLTKKIISQNIRYSANIPAKEAEVFFDKFLNIIKKESATKYIKISKFGSFFYKYTPERQGRNPKTGDIHIIKSFYRFVFKPSFKLKDFLNWYNKRKNY